MYFSYQTWKKGHDEFLHGQSVSLGPKSNIFFLFFFFSTVVNVHVNKLYTKTEI